MSDPRKDAPDSHIAPINAHNPHSMNRKPKIIKGLIQLSGDVTLAGSLMKTPWDKREQAHPVTGPKR
jgi:hypothetical protein